MSILGNAVNIPCSSTFETFISDSRHLTAAHLFVELQLIVCVREGQCASGTLMPIDKCHHGLVNIRIEQNLFDVSASLNAKPTQQADLDVYNAGIHD